MTYIPGFGLFNNNGFCEINSESILLRVSGAIVVVEALVCLCLILVFSVLTYRYTKKNTLEGNTEVKRAIAKNLLYLAISSVLSFIYNTFPVFFSTIRAAFAGSGLASIIVINYVLRIFLNLPSVATPIVAFVILKSVRVATKQIFKKVCSCTKIRGQN